VNLPKKSKFGIWLAFVTIAWVVARFLSDFPVPLTLHSGINEVKQWAGESGDPTSYYVYAQELLKEGSLNSWHPSCFPPGLAFLNSALILFGLDAHWVYWSQTISILFWATSFFILFLNLCPPLRPATTFLILNTFWLLPSMRAWAFGVGTLYSESKAHPFFILLMATFILAFRTRAIRNYVWAGVVMASCIYLRVYFERMSLAFSLALLGSAVVGLVYSKGEWRNHWKAFLVPPLLFLATYQIVLSPWLYRNSHSEKVNAYSMAPAQMHVTLYHLWEVPGYLPQILGQGGNTACLTDPGLCAALHKQYGRVIPDGVMKHSAIQTLLRNPITWYQHRLSNFHQFWIGEPFQVKNLREFWIFLEGVFAYVLVLIGFGFSLAGLFQNASLLRDFSWLVLSFYSYNFVVFTVAGMDIDGRHAIPIRLFAFFSVVCFLALRKETKKTQSST